MTSHVLFFSFKHTVTYKGEVIISRCLLQGGKAKLSAHMGELVESDFTHKSENTQRKKQFKGKVGNNQSCRMTISLLNRNVDTYKVHYLAWIPRIWLLHCGSCLGSSFPSQNAESIIGRCIDTVTA